MPTSLLTFNLLLFLLPGFVTLKVREALTVVGKASDLSRLVDALLFSLYNYAVYFTLARAVGLRQVTNKPKPPVTPIRKGSGERPLTARPSFLRPEYPQGVSPSGMTTKRAS